MFEWFGLIISGIIGLIVGVAGAFVAAKLHHNLLGNGVPSSMMNSMNTKRDTLVLKCSAVNIPIFKLLMIGERFMMYHHTQWAG